MSFLRQASLRYHGKAIAPGAQTEHRGGAGPVRDLLGGGHAPEGNMLRVVGGIASPVQVLLLQEGEDQAGPTLGHDENVPGQGGVTLTALHDASITVMHPSGRARDNLVVRNLSVQRADPQIDVFLAGVRGVPLLARPAASAPAFRYPRATKQ